MRIETEKEIKRESPLYIWARDRPSIQSIYSTSCFAFYLFIIIPCGDEIAIHPRTLYEILIDFFWLLLKK